MGPQNATLSLHNRRRSFGEEEEEGTNFCGRVALTSVIPLIAGGGEKAAGRHQSHSGVAIVTAHSTIFFASMGPTKGLPRKKPPEVTYGFICSRH